MGLRDFEAQILRELRHVTKNTKIRQKDIMEWATTPVACQDGEAKEYLPLLKVYVAYRAVPTPQIRRKTVQGHSPIDE